MRAVRHILFVIFIGCVCSSAALAQSPEKKPQTFSEDGISFEYPAGWNVTNKSTKLDQHLLLWREGSSTRIMILAYRALVTSSDQLAEGRREVTERFIEDAAKRLGAPKSEVKRTTEQFKVGDDLMEAVRLEGVVDHEPSTVQVGSFVSKLRFITVGYVRVDKDSAQDEAVWLGLLNTLKTEPPFLGNPKVDRGVIYIDKALNGRAVSLPKPAYPVAARQAHAQGIVTVQVVINEHGEVSDVVSVSGHPLLVKACAEAARHARFTPTSIAGQSVRVSGVLTYRFIGR